MAERFSCATASHAVGEPRFATASQVRRWLLVEQPGPWGRDAVLDSRLPTDVGTGLRALGRRVGARVLLIRRHGRSSPARRTCFAAVTTSSVRHVERVVVDDVAELLAHDFSALGAGVPGSGEPVDEAVFLVCTNGSHDPCCAQFGRPLARALSDSLGQQVWECSHFGGDRFAGNLVCLPDGVYFGHLDADSGPKVARDYRAGILDLDHLRGRSHLPFAAQAAEHLLRRRDGLVGVDDLTYVGGAATAADRFTAEFARRSGQRTAVTVEVGVAAEAARLTCHGAKLGPPARYRLVDVSPRSAESR